ncbi:MurR/RpiR family transcriptional regulator [[Clostridium] spiroforme]|nr:MurR/RpiR family transcriptional regulator [Thomasclavelia spiroformis]MBM6881369.1 MurR/RpiR family transcriptional regulator [Thomasclavelia spiroformis]
MKTVISTKKFTEREKIIAAYILENSEKVIHMSSRELARNTFTNATTIVRFVKKLGYSSYNDFKINYLYDLKNDTYDQEDLFLNEHENIIKIAKILNVNTEINFFRQMPIKLLLNIHRIIYF